MNEVRIDKKHPLPESKIMRDRLIEAIEKMEVGDSIVMPYRRRKTQSFTQAFLITICRRWSRRNRPGVDWITRREENGVRIWMI